VENIKIYSPLQVLVIALCSGPVGAVYALARNSSELGRTAESLVTVVLGGVIFLSYVLLFPFSPFEISLLAIPAVTCGAAYWFAKRGQTPERTRKIMHRFEPETRIKVAAVIGGALAATLATCFVWISVWHDLVG
jgi:hypothetical protein